MMNLQSGMNKIKDKRWILLSVLIMLGIVIIGLIVWGNREPSNDFIGKTENEGAGIDGEQEKDIVNIDDSLDSNEDIMEDIGFKNYNENRILKIKIINGEECIFESEYIRPGQVLDKEFLDALDFDNKTGDIIAQIYTYTLEGELIGQKNIQLK